MESDTNRSGVPSSVVQPAPLAPSGEGREPATGRFAPGWRGGPGNPNAQRVAELRRAMLAAVTPADLEAAVRALVEKAKAGDVAAIRELLDRVCGKATLPISVDAGESVTLTVPPPRVRGESANAHPAPLVILAPDDDSATVIGRWNPGVKIIVGVNPENL